MGVRTGQNSGVQHVSQFEIIGEGMGSKRKAHGINLLNASPHNVRVSTAHSLASVRNLLAAERTASIILT
jgi:hypothetical protein